MLGLAMRSGKCVCGAEACEKGVKSGKVKMALLDYGVSPNTRKRFADMCACRGIRLIELKECQRLGRSIGKENIKIIGITDNGFCINILKKFEEGSENISE